MVTTHILMLVNGGIATISSIFLNFLLGFLVIKHTPTQLKGYSRLMLMHCVADVVYDLVNFSIGPLVISLGGFSFMIIQGVLTGMDGPTTGLLFTISTWVGLTAVLLIPIDFIYRYMSVCHNYELSTRSIFIMVLVAYFIVWFYCFPVKIWTLNTLYGPTPETANYTEMLRKIPDFAVNMPSYTFSVQDAKKPYTISTAYVLSMNFFTIIVIIYTSIRISWTIRHKTGIANNKRALKINKQVTRILILQAGLPLIVVIGPIIAIITCSILKISAPMIGLYSALVTMWFSSLKPFMTILIIEKYRKHVFGWMKTSSLTARSETTSWVSSSTKTKPTNARIS